MKRLLGMTSIFVFNFVMKYLTDHDFILFIVLRIFLTFFINISMNPLKNQTNFFFPKHLLKDVWMFLQHWATCWCCRPSVEQTIGAVGDPPPPPDQRVPIPIKGSGYWCQRVVTLIIPYEMVSIILWSDVLYDVNKIVYMTIYVLEIELV